MSGDKHEPDDRRRAERAPVNAEFEALSSATFISDLSELGLFLHTARRVEIGTVLQLRFTVLLDDPVVLSAKGRVVRHQEAPSGMGIEFVDPTPDLVLRIHDVVSRQRPRDLGPPIGTHDPNDEVTVHRAPAPDASDPRLEMEKTGLYPSVRIQIHDYDEDEIDEDALGEDETRVVAAPDKAPENAPDEGPGPGSLRLRAGQSQADLTLAEVSLAGRTMEIAAEEIEEVPDGEGEDTSASGRYLQRTLNLKATDVEIVDEDDDEPEGDDPPR